MQASRQSPKKLYQFILSAKQPSQLLGEAVTSLLRRAVESSEHFDFLLHRINWFEHPFTHYQPLFLKILRLYTGLSKQSSKVAYNLLIEALTHQKGELPLTLLTHLFQESYDKKGIILAIKQNYPHKLCPLDIHQSYLNSILLLSKQYENYRTDLLEIVIENLVHFDTELVLADEWVHRPFPEDQKIKSLREQPLNDIAYKFDHLLHLLLSHLQELSADPKIMGQLLLVFQNKVLPIKTTKLIQLVIFFLAEKSRQHANAFVSFLLSNIFDLNHKENHYRIFTQSNFYLFSYLTRSKILTNSSIRKVIILLIQKLSQRLQIIQRTQVNEKSSLKEIYHQHQMPLSILQSIIMTIISREQVLESVVKQKYSSLLQHCSSKLHFQHFLREEILEKMGLNKNENKNTIKLKFSNKFLPATLPKIAVIVDPTTSSAPIRRLPPCEQDIEPKCRKTHKGETPITYCSQTLV